VQEMTWQWLDFDGVRVRSDRIEKWWIGESITASGNLCPLIAITFDGRKVSTARNVDKLVEALEGAADHGK
jgi:hypothetical protein